MFFQSLDCKLQEAPWNVVSALWTVQKWRGGPSGPYDLLVGGATPVNDSHKFAELVMQCCLCSWEVK